MRFIAMVKGPENAGPPPKALMDGIDQLTKEAVAAGIFRDAGGLMASAKGARVRVSNGSVKVIDGPFTEAKEVVGGFATFEVQSKEEVLDWVRRFMDLHRQHWPGWEGESEVRQLYDGPPQHG
jgi:hypothetical protein